MFPSARRLRVIDRRLTVPLFVALALSSACDSGGSSGGTVTPGSSAVLSPTNGAQVPYDSIGVEVLADQLTAVTVTNETIAATGGLGPASFDGVLTGTRFLVPAVDLVPGSNTLRIDGSAPGGPILIDLVKVQHVQPASPLPLLIASPNVLEGPGTVTLAVAPGATQAWTEALVDGDGDGTYESILAVPGSLAVSFDAGLHLPRAVLRAADGVLVPTAVDAASQVHVVEPTGEVPVPGQFDAGSPLVDLEYDPTDGRVVGLAEDGSIAVFTAAGELDLAVAAGGWSGARGIAVDGTGRVYIADTLNHRIWRLDPASGYAPDPTFGNAGQVGSFGTQPSKFSSPVDVAVAEIAGAERVFVADRDNARIQRLSTTGLFEAEFDLDTGEPGSGLVAPLGVVARSLTTIAVLEADRVLVATASGLPLATIEAADVPGGLGTLVDLCRGVDDLLWLVDADTRIVALDTAGGLVRSIDNLAAVGPRALLELRRVPQWQLLLAAQSGAVLLELDQDPEGAAPDDVVEQFLEHLANGEAAGAAALATPFIGALVDQLVLDAAGVGALGALELEPLLAGRDRFTALVQVEVVGDPSAAPFDISLVREPSTGRWLVHEL